ncbi:MAG: hypothetical protein MJ138_02320 [Kiritimatiellae bacterium]|nr:hypothetical protein [Kiritimatiellia bacterium]
MSIRRIESAYAACLGNKDVDALAMSVLVALAYVANEKNNELCFPSDRHLSKLTHMANRTVTAKRQQLKKLGLVEWDSGFGGANFPRSSSNHYRFLFPHRKLHPRYQPLTAPPAPDPAAILETAVSGTAVSGTVRLRGVPRLAADGIPQFDPGGSSAARTACKPEQVDSAALRKMSPVAAAMRACGVQGDIGERRKFTMKMLGRDPKMLMDETIAFNDEVNKGHHAGAENLAAVLMWRFEKIPKIPDDATPPSCPR